MKIQKNQKYRPSRRCVTTSASVSASAFVAVLLGLLMISGVSRSAFAGTEPQSALSSAPVVPAAPVVPSAPSASPYGTCSHLAGGQEHDAMPQNLILMRNAGIEWARSDFSWSGIEYPQGVWHFEHIDRMLKAAEENGITILPILDYHTAWADPACDHPKEWLEYVRQTVTRCKDRIRYWEVWNEENLKGFWHAEPNAEKYAELLKITYETIKSIDPDLQVVYGGLAGVPAEFYEKSLQAGAGKYFDVVNIHPYRGGLISAAAMDAFLSDIQKFHDLTVQYTGSDKPVWITEMGWATPPTLGENLKFILEGSLRQLFPDGIPATPAVVFDPQYPPSIGMNANVWKGLLPEGLAFDLLKMDDLPHLDVQKNPILILPPGEDFPTSYKDALETYVRDGGTLVLTGGVPFYYHNFRSDDGNWGRVKGKNYPGDLAGEFRVSWIAWWTKKGTPEKTKMAFAPDVCGSMKLYPVEKRDGTRFFTDSRLKDGDSLEPLIVATDAKWTDGPKNGEAFDAPCVGIYRFRSDWKGNIIVSAILGDGVGNTNRCSAENQGIFLSQSILLALQNGIERYFCYEFQAVERDDVDPEHHFGITHADLTPKTGYISYKNLTKARPAGSIAIPDEQKLTNNLCVTAWRRPDGLTGYAVWAPVAEIKRTVEVQGSVTSCFTGSGRRVSAAETMTFGPEITYFVGENLKMNLH